MFKLRIFVSILALSLVAESRPQQENSQENDGKKLEGGKRSIVTYLGTDFILPDGCPMPVCGDERNARGCRRRKLRLMDQFNACMGTDDANYPGCVTDRLPNKSSITIPVYANFCSGICYEQDTPENLERLVKCPFAGQSHHENPADIFG